MQVGYAIAIQAHGRELLRTHELGLHESELKETSPLIWRKFMALQ